MRKVDLAGRFERTMNLVRLEIQSSLTQFFESDQLARQLFLDAVGIRFVDSVITDYDRGLWKREGSQLFFLPILSETKLDGMFEPAAADNGGPAIDLWGERNLDWHRHLAAAAASLFGTWVFFYDRARGSYYFPFPRRNYQFCKVSRNGEASIAMPAKRYRDAVEPLLRGFSLEVGQGSLGLARRLDRDVIVEDTFSDPRGSVALEDLVLRNFSFYGFVMSSTAAHLEERAQSGPTDDDVIDQSRFGATNFGLLGLIFPAPLRGKEASSACLRLYEYLKSKTLNRLIDTLEPLACHIDDTVLREALRTVASSMAERTDNEGEEKAASDEQLRRRFAAAVAGRGDPLDGETGAQASPQSKAQSEISNLRDPFAIGAVHILETEGAEKGFVVREYWHGENSIGRSIREQIERDQTITSDVGSFEASVLRNLSGAFAAIAGQRTFEATSEVAPCTLEGFGPALFGNVSPADEVPTGDRSPDAAERVRRGTDLGNLQRSAERWASDAYELSGRKNLGSAASSFGDPGLTNFSAAIRRHKVGEAILTMLGSGIGGSSKRRDESKRSAAYFDLLGRIPSSGGRLESNPWLLAAMSESSKENIALSTQQVGLPLLTYAAYLPKLGLERSVKVFDNGVDVEVTRELYEELFQTHTYRSLLLVALYGAHLPLTGNSSNWSSARVTTLSTTYSGDEPPLRSGIYFDDESVAYGLATSLSDRAFWEQILRHPCPQPPEWVCWRRSSADTAQASIEVVLASSDAKDSLCGDETLPPPYGFAVYTTWTEAASRWYLSDWRLNAASFSRVVRTTKQDARPISRGQPESILKALAFCERENEDRRTSREIASTSCFPRLQSRTNSLLPSALRTARCCPCSQVIKIAENAGMGREDTTQLFPSAASFLSDYVITDLQIDPFSKLGTGAISTVWPLSYGEHASAHGAIILSMPQAEATVRRRRIAEGAVANTSSLSGLATALISQSVDYLEFVLQQIEARTRFRIQLGRFSHSLHSATRISDAFQGVPDLAEAFVKDVNRQGGDDAVPSEEIDDLLATFPSRDNSRARAERLYVALLPLRHAAISANALDKLRGVLGRLYLKSEDYHRKRYETQALFEALTKTLGGLPEVPASASDQLLGLKPFARNASEWICYLLDRHGLTNATIWQVTTATANELRETASLATVEDYPPATISIILDELLKNMRRYGDGLKPRRLRVTHKHDGSDSVGSMVFTVENWKAATPERGVGSGLGMDTLAQIVRANTGLNGVHVDNAISSDKYRAVVRLDLGKYRERFADSQWAVNGSGSLSPANG